MAEHKERLMSGNEAIARGAWEAGVVVAAAYPGTPSTEILETLARYPEVDAEWSPNEKVALEVAVGAAIAGARALAAMKHVGLNVAADPFFSSAYMGVNAGLVVVSADDPGMHSSQNEQDNRLMARAARVALIEPANPKECWEFARKAFSLSETYDTPVLLRTTTRVSHAVGLVPTSNSRQEVTLRPYIKNPRKYVVLPAHGRVLHRKVELERIPALAREAASWAKVHKGSGRTAFITSGICYHYVREAFPKAAVLKLGMTHPLPEGLIMEFAGSFERIVVVEELEPYLEEQLALLGLDVVGKEALPRYGELSVALLKKAFGDAEKHQVYMPKLPPRPPALCPGCSHRGVFYALKQARAIVSGDIGCYTLGALPPLDAMDTCMNMGASITMAHGMAKVLSKADRERLVAVIGDSTFFHSGLTGLMDLVYNRGAATVVVLDNSITAMTGHQDHPGTGVTASGKPGGKVDIAAICRGLGVEDVSEVDPYDILATWRLLDRKMKEATTSVVVAKGPCVLHRKTRFGEPVRIDPDTCTDCHRCTEVACPAIQLSGGKLEVSPVLCIACTHCQQVCANCNAGIDIPLVLELVHQGRLEEAFVELVASNPFPSVAGRVCPHPCEAEINALGWHQAEQWARLYPDLVKRFGKDGKISPQAVEKYVGDWALDNLGDEGINRVLAKLSGQRGRGRGKRAAVIGAGPAGLAAAWYLALAGAEVELMDAREEAGGLMRYGIPDFRLDKEVLRGEMERLWAAGVKFKGDVKLGEDVQLDELRKNFDAVVLATGAWKARDIKLDADAASQAKVVRGLDMLERIARGKVVELGKKVMVVGGGNTAIDCARAAVRAGADVVVAYRRTAAEMPAIPDEVEQAETEGVRFAFLEVPTAVRAVPNGIKVTLQGMKLAEPDESGRRRPMPVPGKTREVVVDTVVLAVGEQPELDPVKELVGVEGGRVKVDAFGRTSLPGVFASGDVAFGYGTVTQSIASGKKVAQAVLSYWQSGGGK